MSERSSSPLIVILAGGQGSRFWPISRMARPKQFLSISASGEMLIQATARRVQPLISASAPWIVANEAHRNQIVQAVPSARVICEPVGRNTAASIGLAAVLAAAEDPDVAMVVLPADHAISDEAVFIRTLQEALELARTREKLVTIGIAPTYAHTGYGYIQRGKPLAGSAYEVKRFFEKPNLQRATEYLESGNYYWNSGMFVWRACVILEAFREYLPALHEGLMEIKAAAGTSHEAEVIARVFPSLESISIDFGVLEHAKNCAVIAAAAFGWNDVGSWDAWADHFAKDSQGNLLHGDVLALDSEGCIIHSENRLTAVVGTTDLVIIDSGDALLVCPRDKVQDVRKIVEELKKSGRNDLI